MLGSLHWVEGELALDAGFFARCTLEDGLRAYFSELERLAESGDFDVLAHFDIVMRGAHRAFGPMDVDYKPFEQEIRRVPAHIVRRGKGLEVNTSGSGRAIGGLYPGVQILRSYRDEGGQIVILGSDANGSEQVGAPMEAAATALGTAGLSTLAVYQDRRPSSELPQQGRKGTPPSSFRRR